MCPKCSMLIPFWGFVNNFVVLDKFFHKMSVQRDRGFSKVLLLIEMFYKIKLCNKNYRTHSRIQSQLLDINTIIDVLGYFCLRAEGLLCKSRVTVWKIMLVALTG